MRFLAAGFGSGGEIDLCLTNFRVPAIADAFRKCIGHLAFVAIVGWRKSLYVLKKFNDLGVVNYTYSSGCVIFKIFELAVSVEDNNVEDGDVLVIRKMFAKSGNVRTVLPDRIIELMLFLPVCKYLHPILTVSIAENPSAVILNLEDDDTLGSRNSKIYLCVCAIVFTDKQVMINSLRVDTAFIYEPGYQVSFRPSTSIH